MLYLVHKNLWKNFEISTFFYIFAIEEFSIDTNQDVTFKREAIFLFNATFNISSFFAMPPSLFSLQLFTFDTNGIFIYKSKVMRKNNLKYHWYGDIYTEKDILKGAEDVSSRQELMELAQEEESLPIINWDKWDELVQQTKQDIKQELQGFEKMYTNQVFVFDIWKQKVIKTFKNPSDCADFYGISREQVTNYIREGKCYYKQGVEFRQ